MQWRKERDYMVRFYNYMKDSGLTWKRIQPFYFASLLQFPSCLKRTHSCLVSRIFPIWLPHGGLDHHTVRFNSRMKVKKWCSGIEFYAEWCTRVCTHVRWRGICSVMYVVLFCSWQIIANHHMQSISFASGGDPVSYTKNFINCIPELFLLNDSTWNFHLF